MNCKRCKKGVFLIVQLRRHYNHRHLPPYYYILPWQMKSIFIMVFSLFCPGIPCFARGSGAIMKCSKMSDHGKSGQNLVSYYYLLVVKLVVKRKGLLLRIFSLFRLRRFKFYKFKSLTTSLFNYKVFTKHFYQ